MVNSLKYTNNIFFQSCNKTRTNIFLGLLSEHKKGRQNFWFLQKESKAQLQACQNELKKETDEVSWLRKELELAQSRNSELERTIASGQKLREDEAAKHHELLAQSEARNTSTEDKLAALQVKTDSWLAKLIEINQLMDSKLLSLALLSATLIYILVCNLI